MRISEWIRKVGKKVRTNKENETKFMAHTYAKAHMRVEFGFFLLDFGIIDAKCYI